MMQYGFALNKRYGQGFRRNVRFDDTAQSFCIDVCLPGKNKWESVDYETAYQDVKNNEDEERRSRGDSLASRSKAALTPAADIADAAASGGERSAGVILRPPTLPAPAQGQGNELFAWGRNK